METECLLDKDVNSVKSGNCTSTSTHRRFTANASCSSSVQSLCDEFNHTGADCANNNVKKYNIYKHNELLQLSPPTKKSILSNAMRFKPCDHIINDDDTESLLVNGISAANSASSSNSDVHKTDSKLPTRPCQQQPDFECPVCQYVATDYLSLQQHVDTKHTELLMSNNYSPSIVDVCPMCDIAFPDTQKLTQHVESHFTTDHTSGNYEIDESNILS